MTEENTLDFNAIGATKTDEVSEFQPFPVGTYMATINKVAHLQSSKKKTDAICFGAQITDVIDADENELEEFGDWQGYEFKPRATVTELSFFIKKPEDWNRLSGKNPGTGEFSGFIPDVCGVPQSEIAGKAFWAEDEEGNPGECLMMDAIGADIMLTVVHETSDSGKCFAVISKVAAAPA